jgi:hypothetical protein
MPLNELAAQYLGVFRNNGEFEGGLSYSAGLKAARLDFSMESLDRVDTLLDQIRTRFIPLSAIQEPRVDEPTGKSVAFGASGFLG